jgi:hypothetical protein
MMKRRQSEFGKGFIYNLVLFVHHIDNLLSQRISNCAFVMKQTEERKEKILSEFPEKKYEYGFNKEVKWWYEKIVPIWDSPEKALSQEIQLWASGASDHLYEMEIPPQFKRKKLGKLAGWLQDFGLEMGHGIIGNDRIYTADDYQKIWETVKEIVLLIDKELGVKPIKGEWE